jgi:EAL domain
MLKVAREFVDGLGRDAHDEVITRAVVELANILGLLTVGEGIETTQQSETVAALGCDIAQGYPFSHPIKADAVSAVMSAPHWSPIGTPSPMAIEAGTRPNSPRRAERRSGRGGQSRSLDQRRLLAAPRRPGVVALGLLPGAERGPLQQLPLPHLGRVGNR